MGSQVGDFLNEAVNGYPSASTTMSPGYDESLNYAALFDYNESPSQDLSSLNFPSPSLPDSNSLNFTPSMNGSPGFESSDDSDSDDVLKYISQMLMEEDMEEKPCMFHNAVALQAAEKLFYDALGQKYPPSPNQHPLIDHYVGSPDDHSCSTTSDLSGSHNSSSFTNPIDPMTVADLGENNNNNNNNVPSVVQTPIDSNSQPSTLPQWSFGSSTPLSGTTSNGSIMSSLMPLNFFNDKESMIQFQKGVEEASKFLPKNNNLVIDLKNITFPSETNEETPVVVKEEKDEHSPDGSRGRKVHYHEDEDFEEGRSSKQSAVSLEESQEAELSDIFDRVLLCPPMNHEDCFRKVVDTEKGVTRQAGQSQGPEGGKGRLRKQGNSKNMVDLRTLLILCAQSTASDDRRTADELLKKIREHSSGMGDGSQRLAHYFANALEARLAGTGSQLYAALSSKRTTAADMIKAYQFFIRVCPFKKVCTGFANHMIVTASEKASKLHIIDFGILYGFQWPILIQRLSERPGGPPKVCITGIDLPQPGFRPAERIEATGRRLARYCERFNVPFEFHAVAQKWESIKVEDLKIETHGVVIVNSLHRFKNLLDETVVVDSPRNAVLNLVRRIKPNVFLLGVVNGSYNAPFFVTRFREALFHYSTLFDMFDTNASREDTERFMFEKEFFGREIMNVVACEGTERVERPETYKQWQVRNTRAGFRQLPLDQELVKKLRCKVKGHYHPDFVVDVDGHWTLAGWKGRIIYGVSAWVPA